VSKAAYSRHPPTIDPSRLTPNADWESPMAANRLANSMLAK
jgi:hypothetical protein